MNAYQTTNELNGYLQFLKPQELDLLNKLLNTSPRRNWRFRGDNARALALREEFILSGPAETGKTLACLTLVDRLARSYPGAQLSIVRKIQADLEATVIQTFRQKILGPRCTDVKVYGGDKAEWFDYPNGSRVWCGGLDKPGKVLSSERDAVYVNQCEELTLEDWETLTTRTTGRAGNIPQAFTFGDCNPRGSRHWILERSKARRLRLLVSRHEDNPALFDDGGHITTQGRASLDKLEALTGLRKKRLHEGLWVQAEGGVYDLWRAPEHVISRRLESFPILGLAADDGFTNPAALLWIGVDPDGRLHIAHEWYKTGKTHQEIALQARSPDLGRLPSIVICDAAAAGLIAEMQKQGLPAQGHKGLILDGIDLMMQQLKVAGDGRPRLTVDPTCINFISEIEDYTWPDVGKPGAACHGLDAVRYFIHYLYAPQAATSTQVVYEPVEITNRF